MENIIQISIMLVLKTLLTHSLIEGEDMQDYVVLLNLDDPTCHALARRLRADSIYCRIMPADAAADEVLASGARGMILATGCTGHAADIPLMMDYLQTGLPMLCLGDAALTLCLTLGGELSLLWTAPLPRFPLTMMTASSTAWRTVNACSPPEA